MRLKYADLKTVTGQLLPVPAMRVLGKRHKITWHRLGFAYDSSLGYVSHMPIVLGGMTVVCPHCLEKNGTKSILFEWKGITS